MTQGLVKAAEDEEKALEQSKMALDGKAVQQTFLPLLINKNGGKETTAELKEQFVHFYGYYEGADAVSGDYFDYKKLDSTGEEIDTDRLFLSDNDYNNMKEIL